MRFSLIITIVPQGGIVTEKNCLFLDFKSGMCGLFDSNEGFIILLFSEKNVIWNLMF